MPEITFDGHTVDVPAGTNLIEAGLQAGVQVPVFCYHRDLGAVGACRVCAVTTTVQGKSRLVMGCMTQVAPGMEVTTLDHASVEFRRLVLEWLMENHPHDCPICDEGGECQLQDLTIAAGQGHRRFQGRKRTLPNQYLGEFIAHEANRCITCYRCSRFYQEIAGGHDFGVMGSRDRTYFGRFEDGPLDSPFSGNLVEFCPTGVFTDKLFRYRARVWDLEQAASICPHCSVGCNVRPGSRHRELLRVRVNPNPAVNGALLCDRGQFGHGWVEDPARPRTVRVRGAESTWDDALALAGGELLAVARGHGAQSIALVTSPRASLETHAALRALATGPLEGALLAHFDDPAREVRAMAALAALAKAGCLPLDQADLGQCDALLVVGTSLIDEAPVATLGARTMARNGGRLFVMNAGERHLADVAERVIPIAPSRLGRALADLAAGREGGLGLDAIAAALHAAKAPGVLAGGDLVDGSAIQGALAVAQAVGSHARFGFVLPGPNGFGAAASSTAPGLATVLERLHAGALRALVVAEADLDRLGPDVMSALGQLELLVVLDHVPGPLADAAHVMLPAATSYEQDGMFVNRAGRAQAFAASDVAGDPVGRLVNETIFPRTVRRTAPRSDVRPAWWSLERLREAALGQPAARTLHALRADVAAGHPLWAPIQGLTPGGPGVTLDPRALTFEPPAVADFAPAGDGALALYTRDRTLGSETLSRRTPALQKMAGAPVALLAPADAARLGINGTVRVTCDGGSVTLEARALDTVPEGVVVVPRDVPWSTPVAPGAAARIEALQPAAVGGAA